MKLISYYMKPQKLKLELDAQITDGAY